MKQILIVALAFYRYWLSPALHSVFPGGCCYQPTCSEYALEAIQLHGAGKGSWLAFRRLLRCHPLRRGGFDPVPLPAAPDFRPDQVRAAVTASDPVP